MGQRLNIEIVKGDKLLANAYYHWSGFSTSAINLTLEIIRNFDYIKNYKVEKCKCEDLLFAIRLLEITGAGLNKNNIKDAIKRIGLIEDNINLKECDGRNEGIIGVSTEDMEETRYWEEGRVAIDIEKRTIDFKVLHEIEESEIQEYKDRGVVFKDININLNSIKFEDVFDLKAFIDRSVYIEECHFHNKFDDSYISWIY